MIFIYSITVFGNIKIIELAFPLRRSALKKCGKADQKNLHFLDFFEKHKS